MIAENENPQAPGTPDSPIPTSGEMPPVAGTPPPTMTRAGLLPHEGQASSPQGNLWVTPDYSYYSFFTTKEFFLFCNTNKEEMFPPTTQEGEAAECIGPLREKLGVFLKSFQNAKGGCGCNRAKRAEQSVKSYCSFLQALHHCPEERHHVKSLLNSVEKIHFWKDGQRFRHQGQEGSPKFISAEAPFIII